MGMLTTSVTRIALDSTKLKEEEALLKGKVSELTIAQKRHYYALAFEQVRDHNTYAKLNLIFLFGLHHFYLGKWQRGCINLGLILLSSTLLFSQHLVWLGITFMVLIAAIELPQLFYSQKIIYTYNNQLIKDLLKQVTS